MSSTADGLAGFDALIGPATFRGGAVGKYVTQGQVGGQNAKIGTFTATATLNAHFGKRHRSWHPFGSITDFREGGSPLAGWRSRWAEGQWPRHVGVGAPIITGAVPVVSPWQTSAACRWEVHGAPPSTAANGVLTSELTDRDKYPASRYPPVDLAGVAGWFNAAGPDTGTNRPE